MTEASQLSADILGAGAGGPLSAPSPWLTGPGYVLYPYGVVVGNPGGLNKGPGALNTKVLYIDGVIVNLGLYLPFTGGTLTGMLTLFADPTALMHAATKQYVDNRDNTIIGNFTNFLPLAGGTLTGPLVLSGAPTVPLNPATKKYVDDALTGLIAVPDAPIDGTIYARGSPSGSPPNIWSNTFDAGTY